jgi:hypothetical protein
MKVKRFEQIYESNNISDKTVKKLERSLKEFGTVEMCTEKDNEFHIKLKTNFHGEMSANNKLLMTVVNAVGDKYPNIDKFEADLVDFYLVLKP